MYVEIQIQRYSQRQTDFSYRPACSREYGVFTVHLWTARNHAFNGGDLMRENQNNRHYEEPTADGASVDVTEPAKSRYISKAEWILLCIEIGMGIPILACLIVFILNA